jgi:hypothetical protein
MIAASCGVVRRTHEMNRRQFIFVISGAAALLGKASKGHAECGEIGAVEFVAGVYQRQVELHVANTPLDNAAFLALFSRRLRHAMQAPRRNTPDQPTGPILNAFFGWGVLPRTDVKIEKTVQMAGREEGPATVRVDIRHRGEIRQSFVRAVREKDIWRVADVSYDSGRSLAEHYRRMTGR